MPKYLDSLEDDVECGQDESKFSHNFVPFACVKPETLYCGIRLSKK